MSLRMPQNLSAQVRFETGDSVLQGEIAAETAAALGRAGKEVEAALARLRQAAPSDPTRPQLVMSAAGAVWRYFVQREACGMIDHDHPIAHYAIPGEVLARVGASV